MKNVLPVALVVVFSQLFVTVLFAEEKDIDLGHYGKTIFEDEFEGKALNKKWGMYKSASTVRDGVM